MYVMTRGRKNRKNDKYTIVQQEIRGQDVSIKWPFRIICYRTTTINGRFYF